MLLCRRDHRSRKKNKHRTSGGKLSHEAKVMTSCKQKRPHSVVSLPSPHSHRHPGDGGGGEKASKHPRRHTFHEVKLSKRELRHLQRAQSPQSTATATSIPGEGVKRSSKKNKKMKRKKDRDDKQISLQQPINTITPTSSVTSELNRAASFDFGSTSRVPPVLTPEPYQQQNTTEFTDFVSPPPHLTTAPVSESLNPAAMYSRKSDGKMDEFHSLGGRFGRLGRRTNSDAQLSIGLLPDVRKERRCPPERSRFYRQFLKSIKYYGISNTVTNRLEPPASTAHISRYHSEDLAASNPYAPQMEKLWLQLQACLRDLTPEKYEEWLFFNQSSVDHVLNKIVHYTFSGPDVNQPINPSGLLMPMSHEGYELLHSSNSTPKMGSLKRGESLVKNLAATDLNTQTSRTEGEVPISDQVIAEEMEETIESDSSNPDAPSSSLCGCKVEHQKYLSLIQQQALKEVRELLASLDRVESLYMNRKRMGDDHHKYRTLFFKRRVEALTLWAKVTHGLADNLCRLSNWLQMAIVLPDVCWDPPPPPESPLPSSAKAPRSPMLIRSHTVDVPDDSRIDLQLTNSRSEPEILPVSVPIGGGGPPSPRSPLNRRRLRTQFSVGSPVDENQGLQSLKPQLLKQLSVARTESSSGQSATTLQRLFSTQGSHQEPYRDFVNRALKRKGISFMMEVLFVCDVQ